MSITDETIILQSMIAFYIVEFIYFILKKLHPQKFLASKQKMLPKPRIVKLSELFDDAKPRIVKKFRIIDDAKPRIANFWSIIL